MSEKIIQIGREGSPEDGVHRYHSREKLADGIEQNMLVIDGVVSAAKCSRYELVIVKGVMFSWDEIEEPYLMNVFKSWLHVEEARFVEVPSSPDNQPAERKMDTA
ncbi:hypothetical protein HYV22_04385 [Candidatus Gottesmanbacteria bacterium]|nr:hypothetical protein [Candidatus Gottesmanbacteria bacterium]